MALGFLRAALVKVLLHRLITDLDLVYLLEANLLGDNHMDHSKQFLYHGTDVTCYS